MGGVGEGEGRKVTDLERRSSPCQHGRSPGAPETPALPPASPILFYGVKNNRWTLLQPVSPRLRLPLSSADRVGLVNKRHGRSDWEVATPSLGPVDGGHGSRRRSFGKRKKMGGQLQKGPFTGTDYGPLRTGPKTEINTISCG